MSLFAIADTHLSLSADKPMDIFNGWSDYVQRLQKNWRAVVTDGDTVVIPGDVSWAMSLEGAEKDFAFLESLPGRKILMKGNHDYWWNTARKMENFFREKGLRHSRLVLRRGGGRGQKGSPARGGTASHFDRKRHSARRRAGGVSPLSADNAGEDMARNI